MYSSISVFETTTILVMHNNADYWSGSENDVAQNLKSSSIMNGLRLSKNCSFSIKLAMISQTIAKIETVFIVANIFDIIYITLNCIKA